MFGAMPKPHRIASAQHLEEAFTALAAADRRLKAVLAQISRPEFVPRRKHGFEELVSIVVISSSSPAPRRTPSSAG